MQHIINPLNMLPQDINKAQSLVQLPRPQNYQNMIPYWNYLGQEIKMGYISHASGYWPGKVRKEVSFLIVFKMIYGFNF